MNPTLDDLAAALPEALTADRDGFRRRLNGLRRRAKDGKPYDRGLNALARDVEKSAARRQRRAANVPVPDYPEELPVTARREAIKEAIAENQVVVVAGETGSGKTTQIPKICLDVGRGVDGFIGHTQPRRIAARSVAARIAEELRTEIGHAVGYKVRFSDRFHPDGFIKLMTDGILLAETQGDPDLSQYDTLIIDEAHERSLNIDFLLGYLKRLLPRRPDLKVIITSATIDTERFAQHFDAPVVEVSGRTYPVEVRYRPLEATDEDEKDQDLQQGIVAAVDELAAEDPRGDILVFLSGEREIRETAEALRKHGLRHTEILPLFSRLSAAEQNRVFQSHAGRRIVLATNVAETSLTVPGIRFVIDPGAARISRYSHRTKVQRLPIEPVAQASANQRAGRCGRVAPGVCIRLYGEQDFQGRPEFTEPEIRRTNLASVILQMQLLGLGDVAEFPFLQPPDKRYINDGYRTLHELGAVDAGNRLTKLGRELARLPLDPRIGRMVLAAREEGSLAEVLVIAAALSIQDPRERPMDAQKEADAAQEPFRDPASDFAGFLRLWEAYHEQARHLSQRKLRRWCRERFISYMRMREWHDTHRQLAAQVKQMGMHPNAAPAEYDALHRALLAGLLSQAAVKTDPEDGGKSKAKEKGGYTGARGMKLAIFPGSGLAKKPPKWIVAAELVETSRLFARTVAGIQPRWLEELGAHLLKWSYGDPHWERRAGRAVAFAQATLYGLVVVPRRRTDYSKIDPAKAREIFIREALVAGDYATDAAFFRHNQAMREEVDALEAKSRRRDLLVDEATLFAFYDERLPAEVRDAKSFERWRKRVEKDDPKRLFLTREALLQREAGSVTAERFPDRMTVAGVPLALEYRFEPGAADDGVTARIPVAALGQLPPEPFEWLVPGLLEEKATALIRGLPKALRKNFVPAPDFAAACVDALAVAEGALTAALSHQLQRMTGIEVPEAAWQGAELPAHLTMNFRAVSAEGEVLGEARDLGRLQRDLAGAVRESIQESAGGGHEREAVTDWDFGELAEEVTVEQAGTRLPAYPALVDEDGTVALRLLDTPMKAQQATRAGLRRLFRVQENRRVRDLRKALPGLQPMCLKFAPVGPCEALQEDLVEAVIDQALFGEDPELPRDEAAFAVRRDAARAKLGPLGNALAETIGRALEEYHQARKALGGNIPPAWLHAVSDIQAQLDALVYPGFVLATPPQWREHLPRYLKAARLRMEKVGRNPERDRANALEVQALWKDYAERAERHRREGRDDPELTRYRWMLEELRVSLFAQELGTAMPVSVKRLRQQWQAVAA